jgi:hypothetical protein
MMDAAARKRRREADMREGSGSRGYTQAQVDAVTNCNDAVPSEYIAPAHDGA